MESPNIEQYGGSSGEPAGVYRPESQRRRSFLWLRWLLIIVASYLTLFSHLASDDFSALFTFVLLFTATNSALTLLPERQFESPVVRRAVTIVDVLFVTATFYVLRVPNTYFYIGFASTFLLAVIWRELRVVLFALLIVSVLFGVFNAFRVAQFTLVVDVEQFLTLALFFVVSIFYVFLSEQFDRDAKLSREIIEEKRKAEVMVEITRGLSSSLKTQDVLNVVIDRLCEVVNASECAIIQIDGNNGEARTMARDPKSAIQGSPIDMNTIPELKEAYRLKKIVFRNDAGTGVVAVPMISQESVIGLIYIVGGSVGETSSESTMRFFEVMASTAANALRNAQMFEEVEQRARTDFMTGLPNHRYFQATLSAELGRAQRHDRPLSLLMIDLDYLKVINDRYGHPSGDMVIRTIARTIQQSCRSHDFAARYGGEEFTVILPETTLEAAITVANRIRKEIFQIKFTGIGSITASVGISNYPLNALSKDDLIRVADQALYRAKNGGRDRVAYFNYQEIGTR